METITREEKLLEAIAEEKTVDITPVTRREMFLAKAAGQNVKTPEPITREEILLSKIHTGGGGLRDIIENGWPGTLYDTEVTEVAERLFYDNWNLKNVNLPNVIKIGEGAFAGSTIEEVSVPSLRTLGHGAFHSCQSLTKVEIGAITTEGQAFTDCIKLKTIICRDTEKILTIDTGSIAGTPFATGGGYAYIPASMWDTYTAVYGDYMVMFRKIEDYPEICG